MCSINSFCKECPFQPARLPRAPSKGQECGVGGGGDLTWFILCYPPTALRGMIIPILQMGKLNPRTWLAQTQLFESLSLVPLGQKGEGGPYVRGQGCCGGHAPESTFGGKAREQAQAHKEAGGRVAPYWLILFIYLATLCSLWELNSLIRDWGWALGSESVEF